MILLISSIALGYVWLNMFRFMFDGLFYLFKSTLVFIDVFVKFLSVLNIPGVFEVVEDFRSLYATYVI